MSYVLRLTVASILKYLIFPLTVCHVTVLLFVFWMLSGEFLGTINNKLLNDTR